MKPKRIAFILGDYLWGGTVALEIKTKKTYYIILKEVRLSILLFT